MARVLYDDDCNLCKTIVSVLLDWDRRDELEAAPIQGSEHLLGDLTPEQRLAAFHILDDDGRRYSGGDGLPRLFAHLPGGRPLAWALFRMPGPSDRVYRLIADNRTAISRCVPRWLKRRAHARLPAAGRQPPLDGGCYPDPSRSGATQLFRTRANRSSGR